MSQFFNSTDYGMVLPITLLTLFALGILLIDLIPHDWKWMNPVTALVGIGFSTLAILIRIPPFWWFRGFTGVYPYLVQNRLMGQSAASGALYVDYFALYFWLLFLGGAAIAILMSVAYLETEHEHHGEYYSLILFAVVGMMCMAAGHDIVLIFIGLELMAISTYVLVGFLRRDRRSNEAALKYLLLGAFSSGIFAYGLSLLYGMTGQTGLRGISEGLVRRIAENQGHIDPVMILALLATATGLLFKVAAVPFHQWAPDAYEGAPTSITGFMSVAVKAAAWAMMLRILLPGLYPLRTVWVPLLIFVSLATMTGANLAALTQTNLKRLLAYSSIAHVGYMLLGLVALGSVTYPAAAFFDGLKGILLYLLVYTFMNLGAFGVITSLRRKGIIGDELDDIAGLYSRRPAEAVLMLVFLLSLAGIPPLAGFYGKYFIFLSLIESGHYTLAAFGVLYSVFGLYYYLKIANAMFMREASDSEGLPLSWAMRIALGITAFGTIFIGVFPNFFINLVTWSMRLG